MFFSKTLKKSNLLTFHRLAKICLGLFLFLFPFQIQILIYQAPLQAEFNPYQSFFLYGADIFLILALLFWSISLLRKTNPKIQTGSPLILVLLLGFFVLAEISVFFSADQFLSFLAVLRFLEFLVLYFLLVNEVLKKQTVFKILIGVFSFQAFLAILQFTFQTSLGLSFLGEPALAPDLSGVAKIDWGNFKLIRPYGTLPHPNVLGGLLLCTIFFTWYLRSENPRIFSFLFFFQLFGLLFTFSRSALFALFIGGFFLFILRPKKPLIKKSFSPILKMVLGLFLLIFLGWIFNFGSFWQTRFTSLSLENPQIQERIEYLKISLNMLKEHPEGVGLNQFTAQMQNYTGKKLLPWEFQPVHNVFLLIGNELSIFALILLVFSFGAIFRNLLQQNKTLIDLEQKRLISIFLSLELILFILFSFDHYFYTLYPAQVFLIILLSLLSKTFSGFRVEQSENPAGRAEIPLI